MAHDTAQVSPRLHQTHENWEASHDFPRFSDESQRKVLQEVPDIASPDTVCMSQSCLSLLEDAVRCGMNGIV